jgi:hypothetical protein
MKLLSLNTALVEIYAFKVAIHYVIYSKIRPAAFIRRFIKPKRAHCTYCRKILPFLFFPLCQNQANDHTVIHILIYTGMI